MDNATETPHVIPTTEVSFDNTLKQHGLHLGRTTLRTLQINVGKLCNQTCVHCHVDAGPWRTELMTAETADRVFHLLGRTPSIETVDFTGGAPELNPLFRYMVMKVRAMGRRILDRCNLTVFSVEGHGDLPEFFRDNCVEVIASLPCYLHENVDAQRGAGVFEKSVQALQKLNSLGYGQEGSVLTLSLVYNPGGAFLPPLQEELEKQYKRELWERFGIVFNRLHTMVNMPIHRWLNYLERTGAKGHYMETLVNAFNPQTVMNLMCRSLISVSWDGRLYDCDFHQALEIPAGGRSRTIWDIESFDEFSKGMIATAPHCFGCTAGTGSSCGGSLVNSA